MTSGDPGAIGSESPDRPRATAEVRMQISSNSASYATSGAQQMLSMLMSQRTQTTGQEMPGVTEAGGRPPGPPPGPPPGGASQASSRFSSDTLSSLLSAQQAPPTASDIASQLISDTDTDGDGSLSLDEIKSKLSSSDDGLTTRFDALDSDSDGSLSADELSSALEARKPKGPPPGRPQGDGGGAQGISMADLASKLISDLDSDEDGALGLDEIKSALSGKDDKAEAAQASDDSLNTAISGLDSDGDGKLSATELTAALEAFQTTHQKHGHAGAESASRTTSVTA